MADSPRLSLAQCIGLIDVLTAQNASLLAEVQALRHGAPTATPTVGASVASVAPTVTTERVFNGHTAFNGATATPPTVTKLASVVNTTVKVEKVQPPHRTQVWSEVQSGLGTVVHVPNVHNGKRGNASKYSHILSDAQLAQYGLAKVKDYFPYSYTSSYLYTGDATQVNHLANVLTNAFFRGNATVATVQTAQANTVAPTNAPTFAEWKAYNDYLSTLATR